MLKNRNVAFIFILITILGAPTSAYANGRALGQLMYWVLMSLIVASPFLYFAIRYSLRKARGKSERKKYTLVIASALSSFAVASVLVLVFLIMHIERPDFYIRFGIPISLIVAIVFLYFAIKFSLRKTEGKGGPVRVIWMVASVLASCGVAVFVSPQYDVFNERISMTSVVEFYDGTQVPVQEWFFMHRRIPYLPQGFGKDKKGGIQWTKNGKTFLRETWFKPLIINEIDGNLYIVELDKGDRIPGIRGYKSSLFMFSRFDGESWREIAYTEFPKAIAKQNLFTPDRGSFEGYRFSALLGGYSATEAAEIVKATEMEVTKMMDPKNPRFRESKTARLWILLETGKQYNETYYIGKKNPFPDDFYYDFISKYMKKEER